jgi:hypothetical protein
MKNYEKFKTAKDDADTLMKALGHVDAAIWFLEERKKTCPDALKSLKKEQKFLKACLKKAVKDYQSCFSKGEIANLHAG